MCPGVPAPAENEPAPPLLVPQPQYATTALSQRLGPGHLLALCGKQVRAAVDSSRELWPCIPLGEKFLVQKDLEHPSRKYHSPVGRAGLVS